MPKWPEGFDQGRRDFLKTAGLALAGAVIGEAVLSTESSAETIEHTENIVASLKAESINNPIDFPDSFKIPEGKDAKLLGALMDFETRKAEVIDQCANEKLGSKKVEDIIKQIQSMRKIFWDQNPEIFGKYGEYSLENYYRTLLVDVPRHFAQYGIAIDPDVDIFKDFQFATYYYQEPKMFFYQIIKSEKTDLMVKGSSEKKKVYFINPLEFQSKKIGQNDRKAKVVAQMMFQNVFIHEDMIKPEIEDFLKRADEIAEQVNSNSSKTLDDKLSFISSQPDQLSAAVVVAQIETALRVAKKRVSEKDVLHDTTIHESVHIRDVKHNPKVGTERFRNAVDYYNKETNFGIYKEISAYLVQLRESSNRIYSFSHILNMFPAEVSNLSPY